MRQGRFQSDESFVLTRTLRSASSLTVAPSVISQIAQGMSKQKMNEQSNEAVAWLPDLIYRDGRFERGLALVCDSDGRITRLASEAEIECRIVRLKDRALLPGLVNVHSHAFQRVIRGRTEHHSLRYKNDNFWTWREEMYRAASRLTPEDIYDASRMTFLEMALSGMTAVGEFHYLHHAPDGTPYTDPNLLAKMVIAAARDVGLRIALLRVAYVRSGFRSQPNPKQARFIELEPDIYLRNLERLKSDLAREHQGNAWTGVAPHSVRAVPLPFMREVISYANEQKLPVHMHIAEQPSEVTACLAEYGRTPIALLAFEGLLSERFTGIHGIHVTTEEIKEMARARAILCACPTTERNLGDGVVPADLFFREGVRVTLGADSHTQIDLLEDARELEYHMRLSRLERIVLTPEENTPSGLAAQLFACVTRYGAESINAESGALERGRPADFFTVDLNDPSIAGASVDDLLSNIVFSLARTAVCEVAVNGKLIVEKGRHKEQREIVEKFGALQRRLWN